MKKTLALVLALVMVLALVPMAFAAPATTTILKDYKITVKADATIGSNPISAEYSAGDVITKTVTDFEPTVTLKAPLKDIASVAGGTSIWDESVKNIEVTVDIKATGSDNVDWNDGDAVVKNGGTDVSDKITWVDADTFSFLVKDVATNNFKYQFTIQYDDATADVRYITYANFTIAFTNTDKPIYELKFASEENAAVNKDGKWYIDSTTGTWTPAALTFNVTKNNGEKFTEIAYYESALAKWPTANTNKKMSDSQINIGATEFDQTASTSADAEDEIFVVVETKDAIYRGSYTLKYRVNVVHSDPKGVFFGKDTYNIAVGEKYKIADFTSIVPVYHSLADEITLEQTASADKGAIDIDGKSIIGINEGTVYIKLRYFDDDPDGIRNSVIYTDTAKVVISGKYTANPNKNYVVTGSKVNVRSGAGTSFAKIGTVSKGDVVNVISIENGWAKVAATNTYVNGYISQQYLALEATSPATPSAKTVTVACRKLNVRAGGSTSFAKIGQVVLGTKLEVVATSNGWTQIKYGTGTAWVCSKYVA